MADLAEILMGGPRGRRLCLEYVMGTEESVRSAVFWLGYQQVRQPGVHLRRIRDDDSTGRDDPTYSSEQIAALIEDVELVPLSDDLAQEALQTSVDRARYWQEPDGEDVVAASPAVRDALRRVADQLVTVMPQLTASRATAQWAVDWRPLNDAAPLQTDPAAALAKWTRDEREEEARAAWERPADPHANWSGHWWSVPLGLVTTRGNRPDALELVEDSLGWQVATVIPVRGAGKTLEIRGANDWADLCREYPFEVTASRRHDWFRVTGRDGRWLIPDWQRVSQQWDAVHLTTLGYLSAATGLIEVDAEYGSMIGGWAPDSTIWLTDVVREWDEPREQWIRPSNDWRWTVSAQPDAR
ncbi:hypothetical protein ACWKWN_19130 [Microbacterium trichothecenolyticum]